MDRERFDNHRTAWREAIDDVRLFHERFGYPPLAEVLSRIEHDGGWDVLIQDDSLRLTPHSPKPLSSTLEQAEPAHG